MKEKAFTLDRGKRYLFYILMIAILGWFLFMQFFGADERSQEMSSGPVIYSGTFIWQELCIFRENYCSRKIQSSCR